MSENVGPDDQISPDAAKIVYTSHQNILTDVLRVKGETRGRNKVLYGGTFYDA